MDSASAAVAVTSDSVAYPGSPRLLAPRMRSRRPASEMAAVIARALEAFGIDLHSDLDYFADDDGSVHVGDINDAAAGGVATGRKIRFSSSPPTST